MIHIHGLTTLQTALCEGIWCCDTKEDVEDYILSLPEEIRAEALLIKELIQLAVLDDFVNCEKDCEDARHCLQDMVDRLG